MRSIGTPLSSRAESRFKSMRFKITLVSISHSLSDEWAILSLFASLWLVCMQPCKPNTVPFMITLEFMMECSQVERPIVTICNCVFCPDELLEMMQHSHIEQC